MLFVALAAGCGGTDGSRTVPTDAGGSQIVEDGSLESCLVGRWEPDDETLMESLGIEDAEGLRYGGTLAYEFKNGGGFVMDIDYTISAVMDGDTYETHLLNSAEGTWTTSGDSIVVAISDSSVGSTNKLNGELVPNEDVDFSDMFGPDDPMTVTCSDSTLVMDAGSGEEELLQRS